MKVIIFGASGIIGQHMRLAIPQGVEPIWVRRHPDLLHDGLDLYDFNAVIKFIASHKPKAVVNLAGESRPDVVEKAPEKYQYINSEVAGRLVEYCQRQNIHYVHVSTQAVFSGDNPPYHPKSQRRAVNAYGAQKLEAEHRVEQWSSGWTIVRPTFVLGVRPIPSMGRENPMEQMLSGKLQKQVGDRFFSVSFASTVANRLWGIATGDPLCRPVHVGLKDRVSRYDLMTILDIKAEQVAHDSFHGIAPRPLDTTFMSEETESLADGLERCRGQYLDREAMGIQQRARELSVFTGKPETECAASLSKGFGELHNAVAADFRAFNPKNDHELLEWYRQTDAYLLELSAYHLDPRFNYSGMCNGVAERLKAEQMNRVLCLGDGIGDLTLTLLRQGFDAVYHDLQDSRTAQFAMMRLWMYVEDRMKGRVHLMLTPGWAPLNLRHTGRFDAVCAFDFLEHVTDVPAWAQMIFDALKPGGLFCAQNAFNCGSGENGSIPMHLTRNDRYETEWDPMMEKMGFQKLSSNWYQKTSDVLVPA